MKFRRLLLHGFKSFVDKTPVDFPGGITCIVGPNGSGKSNILDAVRWVFGEQSAKELRGNDMEDVIFAGSEKRKGSGFAEVSLTLSDLPEHLSSKWGSFSEVTVSRKFYKAGEREYLINGKKCKLKDIKEIFYDTGIGPKSISIIEQGKVDKIIQASPEELRYFLEETAGVVKFKERKKEAERRLGQTRENLSRVNDIIAEITVQLKTLGNQTESLRNYRSLNERKVLLEKQIMSNNIHRSIEEMLAGVTEVNKLKVDLSSAIAVFEELTRQERATGAGINEHREQLRQLQSTLVEVTGTISRLEGDIKMLENNIASAEQTRMQLHDDIERIEDGLKEQTASREVIQSRLSAAEEERDTFQEKIDHLQDIIDDIREHMSDVQEKLREMEDQFISATEAIAATRNKIIQKETHLAGYIQDKARLEREVEEIAGETGDLWTKKREIESELETFQRENDILTEKSVELTEKRKGLTLQQKDLSGQQRELQLAVNTLNNKRTLLQQQIDSQAFGTEADVRIIRELGGKLLIDSLGDVEQKYFVEAGDTVVFDAVRKDEVLAAVDGMKSSLSFTFTDQVGDIITRLTGTPIKTVTETIYKVNGLYKKIGSDDKTFKILELKKEIENTTIAYEEKLALSKDVSEKLSAVERELSRVQEELDKTETAKKEREMTLSTLRNNREHVEQQLERITRRSNLIDRELELAQANIEETEKEIETLRAQHEEHSERQAELDEEKSIIEDKIAILENDLDDRREELHALKIEERGLIENIQAAKKELHFVDKQLTDGTTAIASLKKRLENLMTVDVVNWQAGVANAKEHLAVQTKLRFDTNEQVFFTESSIAALEDEMEGVRKKIETQNNQIKQIEVDINSREIKLAQVRAIVDSIKNQYLEKFGIDIESEYQEYLMDDFQPRKSKDELSTIERAIENLGPLNMAAEAEFDDVQERHDFLSKQRQDLEDSISSINELIYEINDNTVQLFQKTFVLVQQNFLEVFKILFGNGFAELKLTDPEDLLTTGVEIFVQPPGKKLQNMNLMSGGEKALSAMTLLFAIFLQKPTPFCFLDEIDAPLDDANVDRFLNMVKALSDKTQFIIITHNHKTMGAADSLYGVTMQEPGVSKILSVELEKAKAVVP